MNGRTLKFEFIIFLVTICELTTAFYISPHFERKPGDELIYLQTKVTIPTVDIRLHKLVFNWRSTTQQFTQIIVELNGYMSINVYQQPTVDPELVVTVYDNTKQLIVTLLVYGFNQTSKYQSDKSDDVIPFDFPLLDRVTVNNSN